MSTISTPRITSRPSRAVLAGTALGALLIVGGAGIGCAGGGHVSAPQKTVTTKAGARHQNAKPTTTHTSVNLSGTGHQVAAPTSAPAPQVVHPAPPASNPAPVTHGSARGGQGAPTSNPASNGSSTAGPVVPGPVDGSAGATYDPSANATSGYDPSNTGGSYYTPDTTAADPGTDAAPDTTPQPDMALSQSYDQQSWDAWKASSDAANAGNGDLAYQYNQDSINATANSNDAYNGTQGTGWATGNGDAPTGE